MNNFPEPISFLNSVFSPSSEDCRISTHQRPSIDNQLPLLSYQLLPLWFYCWVINEFPNLWEVLVTFSSLNLCYTPLLMGSNFCSFMLIGFKRTSNVLIERWWGTVLRVHLNVELSNRYLVQVMTKRYLLQKKSAFLRLKNLYIIIIY